MQNVGQSLSKSSMMTFALNVTTAAPQDSTSGSVWDMFSPLSKLITIACVDNKAQFEKDAVNIVRFNLSAVQNDTVSRLYTIRTLFTRELMQKTRICDGLTHGMLVTLNLCAEW